MKAAVVIVMTIAWCGAFPSPLWGGPSGRVASDRGGGGGAEAAVVPTPATPTRLGLWSSPPSPQGGGKAPDERESGIADSLTGAPGDPARGRAIVADRTRGLCLLCHSGPIPEERFQGNLAPSLAGAGSRSGEAELRLRLVDSRRVNPDTIMPAYGKQDGFTRIGATFRDKPILAPADIEDVVAYLMTLKEEPQ